MKKISADIIYPIVGEPVRDAVLIVDDDGCIKDLARKEEFDDSEILYYKGMLVPGFINTHCHLELSHMFGKVDTGKGLIPFITDVVRNREALAEEIKQAIERAEDEMLAGGIVAVGDISNTSDTLVQKSKGRMMYYTFVEMFDFLLDNETDAHFDNYLEVYNRFGRSDEIPGHVVCVPHSPYSVSPTLFKRLRELNRGKKVTVSIHNQEMHAENELFLSGSGGLVEFYRSFGISLDGFQPTGRTSIWYALEQLDPQQRTLFVHNTLTSTEEISGAQDWSPHVYWATCPNANLYIENRLPDYRGFMKTGARMTIGTDSLTSNWQLSILEEIKTIRKYNSYIGTEELLQWATLNGARALGFDDILGSFEPGKRPGVNNLTGLDKDLQICSTTEVQRVV